MPAVAKSAVVLAAGVLALALPAAQAKQPPRPDHPDHPGQSGHPSQPASGEGNGGAAKHHEPGSDSHKCVAREVGYVASGTLITFSASQTSHNRYSGAITVHVTRSDEHAASDRGHDVTYTLSNARVRFGKGASATDTGDRVVVIGEVSTLSKKCDQTSFTPSVTVRKVTITRTGEDR